MRGPLKTVLFALVALAVAAPLHAAQITGVVVDSASGDPVVGATVALEDGNRGTTTDASGTFTLANISPGRISLRVSSVGYQAVVHDLVVNRNDETLSLDFALTVKPVTFDDIIVSRTSLVGNRDQIFEIPGTAHYVGAATLETFEYNDINQALREIPGINIQEEDGYGLRPNIGFRGSGSERSQKIAIMEDGVLIAPAPYSAPAAYYFPTVGRMSGIEVRKGSSQIKYGPYTTAGALNLISTRIPDQFAGRVELLGGSDGARRIHAGAGNSLPNFGYLAEAYQDKVDGFKELDNGGNTGYDIKDYLFKVRLNTNADAPLYQQIEFKYSQTDEVSNETYLGLTDGDFERTPYRRYAGSQMDEMNTEHEQFQVRHFIQPTDRLDVTTTAYRNEFSRNWYKLDKVLATSGGSSVGIGSILEDPTQYADELAITRGASSSNDDALSVKANNRSYYSQGIQTVFGLQLGKHELEAGFRYHEDEIDRFQWVDEYKMTNGVMMLTAAGTPGTESNRVSQAQAWAGFAELNLTVGNLRAVPGVRFESIDLTRDDYGKNDPDRTGVDLSSRENQVDIWIPGIGLDYRFSTSFSGFAGVHKGFAPPGSSPGTNPEESVNYELGARYRMPGLSGQAVVFFNDYTNLLGSDLAAAGGSGSGDLFNGGDVHVSGLELSMTYDLATRLVNARAEAIPFSIAYTYTSAEFQNSFESDFGAWGTVAAGDEMPYVPQHQLAARLGYEAERYGVHAGAKYVDEMRTVAGQGNIPENERTDAHLLLDVAAQYSVTRAVKLFGSLRNLLDETYVAARRPAGVRPGAPRTLMLGIKTTF